MTGILPPPPERFDPVTARWVTPGGPLHDPQRDSLDPAHGEPVSLIDPVPPELAERNGRGIWDTAGRGGEAWARRRRWIVLAVLAVTVAAILVGGFLV